VAEKTFQGREIERHPDQFVGLTVTMAGKEAIWWERTTIASFDGEALTLHGGEQVTQFFSDSPVRQPITDRNCRVPYWEIARGRIHETDTEES